MYTNTYFFMFILCVNTMTRMINTNVFFDFTAFQVLGVDGGPHRTSVLRHPPPPPTVGPDEPRDGPRDETSRGQAALPGLPHAPLWPPSCDRAQQQVILFSVFLFFCFLKDFRRCLTDFSQLYLLHVGNFQKATPVCGRR